MWLYEGNGKGMTDGYVGPVHSEDNMTIGCSFQFLMDMCQANGTYAKGKSKNPNYSYRDALRKDLKEYMEMVIRETWEEFGLVADAMAKEMERRNGK